MNQGTCTNSATTSSADCYEVPARVKQLPTFAHASAIELPLVPLLTKNFIRLPWEEQDWSGMIQKNCFPVPFCTFSNLSSRSALD